jgi:oxygen-dependent protoporphyrinogen oxidase
MQAMARSAVVIGAGLAGLTAAYHLRQAGWNVCVLESNDYVGGRVSTVDRQDYCLDTGATQISTGYEAYLKLCRELELADQIIDSSQHIGIIRRSRIYLIDGSRVFAGLLSPLLSLRGKWAMLKTLKDYFSLRPPMDVLDVSRSHLYDVESAAQYSRRRLCPELYETLIDPLLRAYVMNRAENVSCLEWFSGLRNLGGRRMISVNGGNRCLPYALARNLRVHLRTSVNALRKSNSGVTVHFADRDGHDGSMRADACVLATRLPEALSIYPSYRTQAAGLVDTMHYNRGLVVQLGYSRRPTCPALGLLLSASEHAQIALIWLEHNKNPDRVPPGHALFSVYFDETANDRYFASSQEVLSALVSTYLQSLFPALSGALDLIHVTRWPLAVPNPAPGVYRLIHALKARIDPADRIQYAGDYFTCVGQNSAIHYGTVAAENLIMHRALE